MAKGAGRPWELVRALKREPSCSWGPTECEKGSTRRCHARKPAVARERSKRRTLTATSDTCRHVVTRLRRHLRITRVASREKRTAAAACRATRSEPQHVAVSSSVQRARTDSPRQRSTHVPQREEPARLQNRPPTVQADKATQRASNRRDATRSPKGRARVRQRQECAPSQWPTRRRAAKARRPVAACTRARRRPRGGPSRTRTRAATRHATSQYVRSVALAPRQRARSKAAFSLRTHQGGHSRHACLVCLCSSLSRSHQPCSGRGWAAGERRTKC